MKVQSEGQKVEEQKFGPSTTEWDSAPRLRKRDYEGEKGSPRVSLGGKLRIRWEEKEAGEKAERNTDVLREMNRRWRETDRIER